MSYTNENASAAVYSGDVHMGNCGEETSLVDLVGNTLRVGDIVMIFTTHNHPDTGECIEHMPQHPTAVVRDADGCFVMGIKDASMGDEPPRWRVTRIKRYEDVVIGERWPEYGFNYRAAPVRP